MGSNFELVKLALDDLYGVVSRNDADPTATIRKQCATLSSGYGSLTAADRSPLDYSSAAARFAYVYTYVAAHAVWAYELLLQRPVRELIQTNSPLRATCLGGGPGTELIALLNACNALRRTAPISCFLLDGEDGWAETWAEIDTRVGASFRVTTSFRCVNVRRPPKVENLAKAFDAELFLAIYFLSEIYAFRTEAEGFFKQLVESMKPGAMVVYLDNSSDQFTDFAKSIFTPDAFEVLHGVEKTTLQLKTSEEKTSLGDYYKTIARNPRLTSNATSFILRKK